MEYRFSIIVITESWLQNVDTVIPAGRESLGYSFIQLRRSDGRHGGGIELLVKNHITIFLSPRFVHKTVTFFLLN